MATETSVETPMYIGEGLRDGQHTKANGTAGVLAELEARSSTAVNITSSFATLPRLSFPSFWTTRGMPNGNCLDALLLKEFEEF